MWIWKSIIRSVFTGAGLQIGAEFIHAVERVQKKRSNGVDLHQCQIVQLHREDSIAKLVSPLTVKLPSNVRCNPNSSINQGRTDI